MKNKCKANPCCGMPYECEVPLPQHRSGLWLRNSEDYRKKIEDEELTPKDAE